MPAMPVGGRIARSRRGEKTGRPPGGEGGAPRADFRAQKKQIFFWGARPPARAAFDFGAGSGPNQNFFLPDFGAPLTDRDSFSRI